jgi:hypothetical protein
MNSLSSWKDHSTKIELTPLDKTSTVKTMKALNECFPVGSGLF